MVKQKPIRRPPQRPPPPPPPQQQGNKPITAPRTDKSTPEIKKLDQALKGHLASLEVDILNRERSIDPIEKDENDNWITFQSYLKKNEGIKVHWNIKGNFQKVITGKNDEPPKYTIKQPISIGRIKLSLTQMNRIKN